LNTGAGKTIVGLLIAQSLVNEQIEGIIYACSTIDLVLQTAREADRLGIKYTTRISGDFNNDLFEAGKTFCITTYQALFQPYSVFGRKYLVGAIILDDAHTAERLLRDAFTLKVSRRDHPNLYATLARMFVDTFKKANRYQKYAALIKGAMFKLPYPTTAPMMRPAAEMPHDRARPVTI